MANGVEKPDGLRAPNGAAPEKVLLVKGMYWRYYGTDKATECQGTYLGEILPADLKGTTEVVKCQPGLSLGSKAGAGFPDKPLFFRRHDVSAKPAATITAYAGRHPIAFRHTVGKGQALVFAGTVLGGSDKGQPFWQTEAWTGVLRSMILE